MSNYVKPCIIGPSENKNYIGGVATHIKNLKSLDCFQDVTVFDLGSAHSNHRAGLFRILGNIFKLRNNIISGQFSHILINSSIYYFSFVKLLLILLFIPSGQGRVIHVFFHGGRFSRANNFLRVSIQHLLRPILMKAHHYHFLSQVQLEGFVNLFNINTARIYANYSTQAVAIPKPEREPDEPLHLLFVGRLVREKGVHVLLSAFERAVNSNMTLKLTIAGDGPALPELLEHAKRLREGSVHFTGFLSGLDLENCYKEADVLVLPTHHPEGFPYVFIEAMRAGLPFVSTSEGALAYLVQDGFNGFQIPPKDIDSLEAAILKLSGDPILVSSMSYNCQKFFNQYLSRIAAEEFYHSILAKKQSFH